MNDVRCCCWGWGGCCSCSLLTMLKIRYLEASEVHSSLNKSCSVCKIMMIQMKKFFFGSGGI